MDSNDIKGSVETASFFHGWAPFLIEQFEIAGVKRVSDMLVGMFGNFPATPTARQV